MPGGSSKTYTFWQDLGFLKYLNNDSTRFGDTFTRIAANATTRYDGPFAQGVSLAQHGDIEVPVNPVATVIGVPLDAMVSNLGRDNNGTSTLGGTDKVLSQGFTTGSEPGGYRLQGIGVNVEGSGNRVPDNATTVSVAVHIDSSGKPGAKLFDLIQSGRIRGGGAQLLRGAARHAAGTEHRLRPGLDAQRRRRAPLAADVERWRGRGRACRLQHRERALPGRRHGQPERGLGRLRAGDRAVHARARARQRHGTAGRPDVRRRPRHPGRGHLADCRRGRTAVHRRAGIRDRGVRLRLRVDPGRQRDRDRNPGGRRLAAVPARRGRLRPPDQGACLVCGPEGHAGAADQPAVRPDRRTRPAAVVSNDAGRQYGPDAVGHGGHQHGVRDGVQVGQARPGLRDLQRHDRPGGDSVEPDRLPSGPGGRLAAPTKARAVQSCSSLRTRPPSRSA